jgi:hypothetical protein
MTAARIPTLLGVAALLISVFAVVRVVTAGPGDGSRASTPLGTGFTYQGLIEQAGTPFTGNCDFRFGLFDAAVGVGQLGVTDVANTNKPVAAGLFSVVMNASNQFTTEAFAGSERWLSVEVSCPAGGAFTLLGARQQITPAPYATFAQDSAKLGGFPANQYTRYTRTIIVSPVEGDDVASGARLVAAFADISDASAPKRYLVHLEPGQFRLSSTLIMKPFVDLEGAGPPRTLIYANAGTIVQGAANSELRGVSVSVLAAGITAISAAGGVDATLRQIAITGSFQTGIDVTSVLIVEDLIMSMTCNATPCHGISVSSIADLTLRRSDLHVVAASGTARIVKLAAQSVVEDSVFLAQGSIGGTANLAVIESTGSAQVQVYRSQLSIDGAKSHATGMIVTGSAFLVSSRVRITASATSPHVGIDASSELVVRDSDITVFVPANSVAINFTGNSGNSLIQASRITAPSAGGIGVQKSGATGVVRITGTDIESAGAPINGIGGVTRVTASQLRSGVAVAGGANVICAGVSDENTTLAVPPACP